MASRWTARPLRGKRDSSAAEVPEKCSQVRPGDRRVGGGLNPTPAVGRRAKAEASATGKPRRGRFGGSRRARGKARIGAALMAAPSLWPACFLPSRPGVAEAACVAFGRPTLE